MDLSLPNASSLDALTTGEVSDAALKAFACVAAHFNDSKATFTPALGEYTPVARGSLHRIFPDSVSEQLLWPASLWTHGYDNCGAARHHPMLIALVVLPNSLQPLVTKREAHSLCQQR